MVDVCGDPNVGKIPESEDQVRARARRASSHPLQRRTGVSESKGGSSLRLAARALEDDVAARRAQDETKPGEKQGD